eukprot:COSAG01_NODE_2909_length_6876_cov_2.019171_4_plen_62_part_00
MTLRSRYNSRDPARLYGWTDRGTLEVGMRADVNVVRDVNVVSIGGLSLPGGGGGGGGGGVR